MPPRENNMLKIINTKVLIAILAVLTAIAGLLVHQHEVSERNAQAAEKAAAILAQQQREAEAQKKAYQDSIDRINKIKKQQNLNPGHESKGWQTYIP